MYFYQPLLLICIILILIIHTQSQNQKGPGKSSCCFYGAVEEYCGLPDVKITDIPEECTCIIFDGVPINLNNQIGDPYIYNDYKYLDIILKNRKCVMVYYFYKTQAEWTTMLEYESSNGGSNFSNEMKGLKTFLDQHPKISGLILSELQYDYTSIEYPKFTENFKKYLEAMRGCFPDLVIALSLYGSSLIDQYIFPALKWLNIKKIDSYLDFYTVDLVAFNRCTDEFKNIGTAPMSASDTNYTLDNIKEALKLGGFPKEKTYFKFRISPSSADESLNACILNVEQMCLYPNQTSNWCADTQSSFNEKGQFACTNGVGFMVHYIDFNDPHNCCRCEKPYPSFNAILDGWKGVDTKPCNSLTRL